MKITINGEEYNFDKPLVVDALIKHLQIDPEKVAIEQNLAIIPLSEYATTQINEGDKLEIVNFIGGG